MLTPRPYLSFSQMTTFEMSKSRFIEQYIYDKRQRTTRNMAYGSIMAEGLEAAEATGDPVLDLMMSRIPKFERMDRPVEDPKGMEITDPHGGKKYFVPVLTDKKMKIPLLAKPDTATADYSAFKEYKTSVRPWTQKMANDSGQVTFYATAIWLATGKIPQDIELVNVQVGYNEDSSIAPTGELFRFPTERTMIDIIKMTGRIKKAWHGIIELCEKELI